MKTTKIFLTLSIILTTILFLESCKKVTLPDNQSEQLIGKWKYISSNGGMTGMQEGSNVKDIEFTKYGKYKKRDNKLLTFSEKFKIELGRTIFSINQVYLLKYSKGITQSFKISNDTLYLNDEAFDAYGYIFVRK